MELSFKLLDLINKGYVINDIISELNISYEEVYKLIRDLNQLGFLFNKKYYSTGDILYLPKKDINRENKNNSVNIITDLGSNVLRLMLVSDLHIGSNYESVKSWDDLYNYCIINNIHMIVIVGDFLDGINVGRTESKMHSNSLEQIEYARSKYPFDKNILNFMILGNHDIDSLISDGIDLATYLNNYRPDIVPIGYGNGIINIKNDKLLLAHPLCIGVSNTHDLSSNYILIKGHQHLSKSIIGNNGNCSLCVPSLSNLFLNKNQFLPGAIDLSIKFRG